MIIQSSTSGSARKFVEYNEEKVSREMDGKLEAIRLGTNLSIDLETDKSHKVLYAIEDDTFARKKTKAIKKFIHFKVALHPEDKPSKVMFNLAARRVLREFNLQNQPHIVYQHFDRKHPHIHLVVNRINENGRAIPFKFNRIRQKELAQRLEQEFGLIQAAGRTVSKEGLLDVPFEQSKKEQQNNQISNHRIIQESLKQCAENGPSMEIFCRRAARRNVNVAMSSRIMENGQEITGMSYALVPGEPKFKSRKEKEEEAAATKSFLLPNGLTIPVNQTFHPIHLYPQHKVRGSRLGPAFQYKGLMKKLDGIEPDVEQELGGKPKITRNHEFKRKYFEVSEYIKNEPPALSKLICAIEQKDMKLVAEAVLDGAAISMIDRREHQYFSKDVLKQTHILELSIVSSYPVPTVQVPKPYIEHQFTIDRLLQDYKLVYGKEANKETVKFAEAALKDEHKYMYGALTMSLNGDHKKDLDVRILPDALTKLTPDYINFMIHRDKEVLYKLSLEDHHYMTVQDKGRYNAQVNMQHAIDYGREDQVAKALKNPSLDLSKFTPRDFNFIQNLELKREVQELTKGNKEAPAPDPNELWRKAIELQNFNDLQIAMRIHPDGIRNRKKKEFDWLKDLATRRALEKLISEQDKRNQIEDGQPNHESQHNKNMQSVVDQLKAKGLERHRLKEEEKLKEEQRKNRGLEMKPPDSGD